MSRHKDYRNKRKILGLCGHSGCQNKRNGYYCDAHKAFHNARLNRLYHERERKIITAYGGCCNKCGEARFGCLELDHVNDDGNIHRRELGCTGGPKLQQWIIKNNYPNTLQLLCANCHRLKHYKAQYGTES